MKTNETAATISFFKKLTSTIPFMEVTLAFIYNLIKSFDLKEITQKIREGKASKKDLPAATFSATFFTRCLAGLKDWSSYLCMDIDEFELPASLKDRISIDVFLNAVLMYISPRGRGLKIIVRVKDGVKENHALYFQAIAIYLKKVYGVDVDASGKDIPRLAFLCHDEDVYYNPDGFVTSEALLRLLPAASPAAATAPASAAIRKTTATARNLPPAGPSTGNDEKPSTRLNKLPEIHNLAVNALERNGWQPSGDQKGELITRPNKAVKDGCSAIYNFYEKEGIWIMTVFSNKAHPFKAHKGYSDVQILCLLDYNDDWTACISDLASRYLEPV